MWRLSNSNRRGTHTNELRTKSEAQHRRGHCWPSPSSRGMHTNDQRPLKELKLAKEFAPQPSTLNRRGAHTNQPQLKQ